MIYNELVDYLTTPYGDQYGGLTDAEAQAVMIAEGVAASGRDYLDGLRIFDEVLAASRAFDLVDDGTGWV